MNEEKEPVLLSNKEVEFVVNDTPGYHVTEADLIILLSELKLIIYGLKGSDDYPGIQFEACGVDSYSLSDRAKECMSMENYAESDHIGYLADGLAKDITFFLELKRWMDDVTNSGDVIKVVKEMREAYGYD